MVASIDAPMLECSNLSAHDRSRLAGWIESFDRAPSDLRLMPRQLLALIAVATIKLFVGLSVCMAASLPIMVWRGLLFNIIRRMHSTSTFPG